MKKRLPLLLAAVVLFAWVGSGLVSTRVVAHFNRLVDPGPYEVSEAAAALHRQLLVADLHVDSLLWRRDLRQRGRVGHADLPRLADGGVGLVVFGIVTKVPRGLNFERNRGDSDSLTPLVILQRWPPRTWGSLFERARYQARRLARLERTSDGRLTRVGSRADLEELLRRRAAGEPVVGALLGLEGAHALEGQPANLERLYDDGLRMLGLAHFFDNEVTGSAHGVAKGGLSELGRQVVSEAERLGIAIDLAHASPAALREVTSRATKPVVVSHTGVRGTCDGPRNLTDEQLRAVAATGGVVGIALFPGAVCGSDVAATVEAIVYAVGVVGADHVALGSDFDGATTAPVDAGGLALVTEGLLARGLARGDVAKILGGNAVRLLRQTLPAS